MRVHHARQDITSRRRSARLLHLQGHAGLPAERSPWAPLRGDGRGRGGRRTPEPAVEPPAEERRQGERARLSRGGGQADRHVERGLPAGDEGAVDALPGAGEAVLARGRGRWPGPGSRGCLPAPCGLGGSGGGPSGARSPPPHARRLGLQGEGVGALLGLAQEAEHLGLVPLEVADARLPLGPAGRRKVPGGRGGANLGMRLAAARSATEPNQRQDALQLALHDRMLVAADRARLLRHLLLHVLVQLL